MFTDCGDRNLYIKCFVILSVIYVYARCCIISGTSPLLEEIPNHRLVGVLLNIKCYKN